MSSVHEDTSSDVLDPSELGTKAYWDNYYQRDLDTDGEDAAHVIEPSQLESWFDDVGAPEKVSGYLTSGEFPLFSRDQNDMNGRLPCILDLGTGNGSTLMSLAIEDGVKARMVGVDYSEPSILLARQLWANMLGHYQSSDGDSIASVDFAVFDIIRCDPRAQSWWPSKDEDLHGSQIADGFDLVLDKGTFDAISLSSETVIDKSGTKKKFFETYPSTVANMVRPGGFFLITSCNWTEAEVIKRFSANELEGVFEVFHKIKYAVYQFGGQQGQGVASVCFRKI